MNNILPKSIRFTLLAALIIILLLVHAPSASAFEPAEQFKPVKIADAVKGLPGTVAWSPDGSRLAYITEGVAIYEIKSGESSSAEIKEPYFISWADQKRLIVLHGEGKLSVLDANTRRAEPIDVPSGTVAAYSGWDAEHLLVFTARNERISIGVEIAYGIHVLNTNDGSVSEVFATSRILPRRYSGSELLKGWMSAGPSPVSNEVMLLEFVVPPNAPPYTKAILIDPFTMTSRDVIDRYRDNLFNAWGAWSPLGRRVALVDEKGRLRVLSRDGETINVDDNITGRYPSWDLRGERLFLGGYLIDSDGSDTIPIVEDRPDSAAFFSPDGGRIALSANSELWLLKNLKPSEDSVKQPADISDKTALLRELYSDGFLTAEEYLERLYAIIDRQGKSK